MNTQQAIRVACVGAGYFSRFHYESWSRMPGAVPIASCNRDINKAKETGLAAYDDLSKMLDAVAVGRKIYSNLKKAIRYIISIHIPIILIVFI